MDDSSSASKVAEQPWTPWLKELCKPTHVITSDELRWQLRNAAQPLRIIDATFESKLQLRGVICEYPLEMLGCKFGDIDFRDARLRGLTLNGSECKSFDGANIVIAGTLNASSRTITSDDKPQNSTVPFKCQETFDLSGAKISSSVVFSGSTIGNGSDESLLIQNADISGSLVIGDGFVGQGMVTLAYSRVKGGVWMNRACIRQPSQTSKLSPSFKNKAIHAVALDAGAMLEIRNCSISGEIDLQHAKVKVFNDDDGMWGNGAKVNIYNFRYECLPDDGESNIEKRVSWINKITSDSYTPQPYDHLAHVVAMMGHDEVSRRIIEEKTKANLVSIKKESSKISYLGKLIIHILIVAPMNYRPHRALFIAAFFWLIGCLFFVYSGEHMHPSRDYFFMNYKEYIKECARENVGTDKCFKEYMPYNGVFYSFDAFVPFLNLRVEDAWTPTKEHIVYIYWIYVVVGWASTYLVITSLSGALRRM